MSARSFKQTQYFNALNVMKCVENYILTTQTSSHLKMLNELWKFIV